MSSQLKLVAQTRVGAAAPPETVEPGDSLGWLEILRLVRRRIRLIVALSLLVGLAALPVILAQPKLYYAETRVLLATPPATAAEPDAPGAPLAIDTEIERLLARDVSEVVIAELGLATRAEFNRNLQPPTPLELAEARLRQWLAAATGRPALVTADEGEADQVYRAFRDSLAVSRQGLTNVVAIGFTSRDPALAERVPSEMVEGYLARIAARHAVEMDQAVAWLDARLAQARARVETARSGRDALVQNAGLATPDPAENVVAQLSRLEERRTEVLRERSDIAATLASVEASRASPRLPALSEPGRLVDLRRELQREEQELAKVASFYGAQYEGMAFRQGRVQSLQAQITAELAGYANLLALRDEALAAQLSGIDADLSPLRARLADLRAAEPAVAVATDELIASAAAVSDMEARRAALLATKDVLPVGLEVLVPPARPLDPLGPGRKLYLVAALVGGAMLGLIAAGLAELSDTSMRSQEQMSAMPRTQPLGVIPRPTRRQRREMPRLLSLGIDADVPAAAAVRDALFLLGTADNGQLPPITVVAPARRRDAVVPVAEWLACAVASSGKPVWLLDAVGRTFPKPLGEDGVVRLHLPTGAESSGEVDETLSELTALARRSGGLVVVDAPPLHTSQCLALAKSVGHVVFVLRWGRTPRAIAELSLRLLSRMGPVPVAVLIVDADMRRHRLHGFSDRLSLVAER